MCFTTAPNIVKEIVKSVSSIFCLKIFHANACNESRGKMIML